MNKKLAEADFETPPSITVFQQLDSEYSIIEQMISEHPSEGSIISFLIFLNKVKESELRNVAREATQKLYANLFTRMRKSQNILRDKFGKDVFEHARKQVKALFQVNVDGNAEVSLRAVEPKKKDQDVRNKKRKVKTPERPEVRDCVPEDKTSKPKTKRKLNPQLVKLGKAFERKKFENQQRIAEHLKEKAKKQKPKTGSRKTKKSAS